MNNSNIRSSSSCIALYILLVTISCGYLTENVACIEKLISLDSIDDAKDESIGCRKLVKRCQEFNSGQNLSKELDEEAIMLIANCFESMTKYTDKIFKRLDLNHLNNATTRLTNNKPCEEYLNEIDFNCVLQRQSDQMAEQGIIVDYIRIMEDGFHDGSNGCPYYTTGLLGQFIQISSEKFVVHYKNMTRIELDQLKTIKSFCDKRKKPISSWDSVDLFQKLSLEPKCTWSSVFLLDSLYRSDMAVQQVLGGVTHTLIRNCLDSLPSFYNNATKLSTENLISKPKQVGFINSEESFNIFAAMLTLYLKDHYISKNSSLLEPINPRNLYDNRIEMEFFLSVNSELKSNDDIKFDRLKQAFLLSNNLSQIYEDGNGICDFINPDLKTFKENRVYLEKLFVLYSIGNIQFHIDSEIDNGQFRSSLVYFMCQSIKFTRKIQLKSTEIGLFKSFYDEVFG